MPILALINMSFTRPSSSRTISFSEISARLNLPEDQLEMVIMKCLSLKLITGKIDQASKLLYVDQVAPRVLNQQQIEDMRSRLGMWRDSLGEVHGFAKDNSVELFE